MDKLEVGRLADQITFTNQRTIIKIFDGSELYGYFEDNQPGSEFRENNKWNFIENSKIKRTINGSDIKSIRTILLIDNMIELHSIRQSRIPNIAVYKKIMGYQVYHSTENEKLFLVYDNIDKYYLFIDRGSNDLESDLTARIAKIFIEQ